MTENVGIMEIGIALGWIGSLAGWGLTIFRSGKANGILSSRVEIVEHEIIGLKSETGEDLEKVNRSIEKLLRCFTTADGEPRFVSHVNLDKIMEPCRKISDLRLLQHDKVISAHEDKLDKIISGINDIKANRGMAVNNGRIELDD